MNASQYCLGRDLAEILPSIDPNIYKTISDCLACVPEQGQVESYQKEMFYTDGTPVLAEPNTVYPVYAARYLGVPIPEAFSRIEVGYSRSASRAALGRAIAMGEQRLPVPAGYGGALVPHIKEKYGGIRLAYGDIFIGIPIEWPRLQNGSIIVPIADTFRNDADWGQGAIPYYVELYVRFYLWCYQLYCYETGIADLPEAAVVSRIIGNLPTDTALYTIYADSARDQQIAERVIAAFMKAQAVGKDPLANTQVAPDIPWQEKKELELQDAYQTDATLLYELVKQYMLARSTRKELEAKDKELKEKADTIAVALAAMISGEESGGKLDAGSEAYFVNHTVARRSEPRITPPLIYQLAPTYAGQVITESGRKVSVSIDVL